MGSNHTNRRPTWQQVRRAGWCMAAALLATACAHTASPTQPPDTATVPQTLASATDQARHGGADLCARFTIAALGSDTATDAGPADARRRAAQQFGTPTLIDGLVGEGRDTTWPILAEHHARVQISIAPVADDPPPQDGEHAGAAVVATRTAVADDGWRRELPSIVVYCALRRTQDGWKVADVIFSDTTNSKASG